MRDTPDESHEPGRGGPGRPGRGGPGRSAAGRSPLWGIDAAAARLLARLDGECPSLGQALAETGRLRAWTHEVEILVEDLRAPGFRERAERRGIGGRRRALPRRPAGLLGGLRQ